MRTKNPIALAVLGCCATLAAAQEFNIKPGLWELTVIHETKGDPMSMMSATEKAQMEEAKAQMEEAKAHMSPEQRAQMETLMKQPGMWGGPPKTSIEKKCVTKEDILKMREDVHKMFVGLFRANFQLQDHTRKVHCNCD